MSLFTGPERPLLATVFNGAQHPCVRTSHTWIRPAAADFCADSTRKTASQLVSLYFLLKVHYAAP